MKAHLLATLFLIGSFAQAAAQPRVRVEIEAKEAVLVGQQVRVSVTVLAPNYFLSSPQFPNFDIPGAVVTLPDENALNSSETIDGEAFAGISRGYLITPQQAGTFALPPARITFRYAAEPGKPGVDATVTLPAQTFAAKLPEGAGAAASSSLVDKIRVTQTLDGNPQSLKVGDALTRTVEIFAANTQAMFIPPPEFDAPVGVRLYRRDPLVTDVTTDRGNFAGGRRIDAATYVFDKPGSYTLPSIDVSWFNADTGKPETSSAPAIMVSVAPVTSATEIAPPPAPQNAPLLSAGPPWGHIALALIGLIVVTAAGIGLWFVAMPAARAAVRAIGERREASEAAAFAKLKAACRSDNAAAAYRALGAWADRNGFASVHSFCDQAPALRANVVSLEVLLFAEGPTSSPWIGDPLLQSATRARRLLRKCGRDTSRRTAALPLLNP